MADRLGEPSATGIGDQLASALLARRILLVRGELDHAQASDLAAALMTLDATGDERVELRLTSTTASFDVALMLIDVISVLGVPVHVAALGLVSGGAVGVLATGAERSMSRHARLCLREPDRDVAGRAVEIERALAEQAARRDLFFRRLSERTRRSVTEIDSEWAGGRYLDAEDAVTLGYADRTEGEGRPRLRLADDDLVDPGQ